ncbi:hypothetical protein BT93_I0505 [Corymbia citriodora subsp. variegata]|nr:hypothetical protein BT93_I0505 [Corymbia citriodora subsp. variegata]
MLSFFQNTLPLSLVPKHLTTGGRPPSSKASPSARYLRLHYRLQESLPHSQKPPSMVFRAQIRRHRHDTSAVAFRNHSLSLAPRSPHRSHPELISTFGTSPPSPPSLVFLLPCSLSLGAKRDGKCPEHARRWQEAK